MNKPKFVVRDFSYCTFGLQVPGASLGGGVPYYAVLLRDKARKGWRDCLEDGVEYYQEKVDTLDAMPDCHHAVPQTYHKALAYLKRLLKDC